MEQYQDQHSLWAIPVKTLCMTHGVKNTESVDTPPECPSNLLNSSSSFSPNLVIAFLTLSGARTPQGVPHKTSDESGLQSNKIQPTFWVVRGDLNDLSSGLRRWQKTALAEWVAANYRGIVEVVTGGGKTRFALAATSKWLSINPHGVVVVIVPTTSLQDQWCVNLESDLGTPSSTIAVWPECKDVGRQFHIMVVNTARNQISRVTSQGRPTLLIADECHRYASEENSKAISIATSASLGLTATAERQYDDGLERTLVPHIGPIIFNYTLREARTDGVVVDFALANLRVSLSRDEEARIGQLSKSIGMAMQSGDLEKAKRLAIKRSSISKNTLSRISSTIALMETLRGKKAIVFHEDIAMADLIAGGLQQRGHRVVAYHSRIGKDFRRDNLRMFRTGLADVLVCCRALDEGIDLPEAECAILAASTSSHRQRVQRLGRVLRTHKAKDLAVVYSLYATEQERESLVSESKRLDGVAKTTWLEARI